MIARESIVERENTIVIPEIHEGFLVANRFEVGRVAGKGGMATVHEAHDRATGQLVALKVVGGVFANPRFEREASLLARLSPHPGIVRYVAHGRIDSNRMYLAMEWLRGVTLEERLRLREGQQQLPPLSFKEAFAIGARIARALDGAHKAGVIHRDIKPSNIILRGDDATNAVVIDFGVARAEPRAGHASRAMSAMTATGAVIGTPAYMAPEQVRGDSKIDARADLFSLGCVLFECLAGQPPFVGEHLVAVLAKILLERAPRITSLRDGVPAAIDELVAALLEKSPEARPPSGEHVASVLEALLSSRTGDDDRVTTNALRERQQPPITIGLSEQRLATVLLARQPRSATADDDGGDDPSVGVGASETLLAGLTLEGLSDVAARFGMEVQSLADGSFVGMTVDDETGVEAVRAALALSRELDATGLGQLGIAVATGRAIAAGVIPVGDAIDVAARIAVARGRQGGVWICPTTFAMVGGRFDVAPPEDDDADAIRVRSEKASRARRRTTACCTTGPRCTLLGRVTPFVGRHRELSLLEATFAECVEEPIARAMLVVAPPGIGKSRLQRELVAKVGAQQSSDSDDAAASVWIGFADPLTLNTPFAFVADLARRIFGIVDDEPSDARCAKILKRVRELSNNNNDNNNNNNDTTIIAHPERLARQLAAITGNPFDEGAGERERDDAALRPARRDTTLFAAQTTEAFVELVRASLAEGPHLLVLEDVHWADSASMRLLGTVLARAKQEHLPLMVLALARPSIDEVSPRLWHEHRCQRLELEPLLDKAATLLARAVLATNADAGADADSDAAVMAIVARAGGNPLFIEELARAVTAEKRAPGQLPATIAAVIENRLTVLSPATRRVLRAAAVFGVRFWAGGVAALIGPANVGTLEDSLALLEQQEIIEYSQTSRFGEGEREYVFRHAIVRDVAYEMLAPIDRTIGHALAGDWLAQRIDDGAMLAHHFELGERPNDAARWSAHAHVYTRDRP